MQKRLATAEEAVGAATEAAKSVSQDQAQKAEQLSQLERRLAQVAELSPEPVQQVTASVEERLKWSIACFKLDAASVVLGFMQGLGKLRSHLCLGMCQNRLDPTLLPFPQKANANNINPTRAPRKKQNKHHAPLLHGLFAVLVADSGAWSRGVAGAPGAL